MYVPAGKCLLNEIVIGIFYFFTIGLEQRSKVDPCMVCIDVRKQTSSFPANFVHSLDASHMFATAMKCREVKLQVSDLLLKIYTMISNYCHDNIVECVFHYV